MALTSSPGKVLFLGGYSVLEEGNPALSFAVTDLLGEGVVAETRDSDSFRLLSPGFGIDSTIDLEKKAPRKPTLSEASLIIALNHLKAKGSLPEKKFSAIVRNSPIFGRFSSEGKTGLGSSAGTAVSIVLSSFLEAGLGIEENREEIHKLAQIANSLSTGGKGSGFDVATAVFGTIVYRRFPKTEFSDISGPWDSGEIEKEVGRDWKGMEIEKFSLPEKCTLLIFDILGKGTDTKKNVSVARALSEKRPDKYFEIISAQAKFEEMAVSALRREEYSSFQELVNSAREESRKLAEEAKRAGLFGFVPVEPESARRTIDSVLKEGLAVAGRCPGSGGFDSVAFLCRRGEENPGRIEEIGKRNGLPLKLLPCRLAQGGVRETPKNNLDGVR